MAEMLVAVAARNFPRGGVVAVKPDGWLWGSEERPPRWRVIRVPGVAAGDLAFLLESRLDTRDAHDKRIRRLSEALLDRAATDDPDMTLAGIKDATADR